MNIEFAEGKKPEGWLDEVQIKDIYARHRVNAAYPMKRPDADALLAHAFASHKLVGKLVEQKVADAKN